MLTLQAVRGAVVKRLEWLDANFLAAVNAYLSVPGVRDNPELANLLTAVRQETLELVSLGGRVQLCAVGAWGCLIAEAQHCLQVQACIDVTLMRVWCVKASRPAHEVLPSLALANAMYYMLCRLTSCYNTPPTFAMLG